MEEQEKSEEKTNVTNDSIIGDNVESKIEKDNDEVKKIEDKKGEEEELNLATGRLTEDQRYYRRHKEERLTYNQCYYRLHREEICKQKKDYQKKHQEEIKKQKKEYYETHKQQVAEWHKRYQELHRDERLEYHRHYYAINRDRYRQKRKEWNINHKDRRREENSKHKAKRRNGLGFIPINEPFEGCEGHHIDFARVIYMPKEYHRSIAHNVWTGKNMVLINALAWDFFIESKMVEQRT